MRWSLRICFTGAFFFFFQLGDPQLSRLLPALPCVFQLVYRRVARWWHYGYCMRELRGDFILLFFIFSWSYRFVSYLPMDGWCDVNAWA